MTYKLIYDLFKKDIIKYGDFTLKSGIKSNIYIDLRTLISYPFIMNEVLDLMYQKIKDLNYEHSYYNPTLICGPAYTGIPMATGISLKHNIPMILIRKERKDYGTKKLIEGVYKEGQKCIMLDDIITTGSSLLENINILKEDGLIVEDLITFIDRREERNDVKNYNVHSVFKMNEIMEMVQLMMNKNKILKTVVTKNSNVVLSIDLNDVDKILELTDMVKEYICGIKIHVDILDNFSMEFVDKLRKMADTYNFFIIADRKFSDIGNTVNHQLHNGVFKISSWADLVTVHTVMGEGTVKGLISDSNKKIPGLLLLGQASSEGNLIDEEYTQKTVEIAQKYRKNVVGFIAQEKLSDNFLHFTPGIHLSEEGDSLGQQYNDPVEAINKGTDIIIVGRGIYGSEDPEKAAEMYVKASWRRFHGLYYDEFYDCWNI